jgi:transposase
MSTSLLYHAFGATTYDYQKTEYHGGAIYFHLRKKPCYQRCVACGRRNFTFEGYKTYLLHTLPIGSKPVFLVLHLQVLACKVCGSVLQESRDVALPLKRYTRAFARYVVELSREMTISAIAAHLKVGWDLIKSIIKEDLRKRARRRSWRKVRRIGIDEIAIRKGHDYMTVVMDLDSGHVLYTAPGKDHTALQPFFRRLRRSGARLSAIAVDMSAAYLKAIELYAPPGVQVVHDHYHLVANMNEVITKVRRDEQNRMEDKLSQIGRSHV